MRRVREKIKALYILAEFQIMRKVAVPAAATHAHMTRLSTNTTKASHHATGETNGTHDAACATSHQPTSTVNEERII